MSIDSLRRVSHRRFAAVVAVAAERADRLRFRFVVEWRLAPAEPIVFSPEGNNLWAYETTPPFVSQKVNAANYTFDGSPGSPDRLGHQRPIRTFKKAASAT
ncbi:MAG: hypothetical protein U0802_21160 [Candidatus Binatia bacterium]